MRKRLSILVTLLLSLGIVLASFVISFAANSDKVIDQADILTEQEEQQLEADLAQWCEDNQFDIVILTTRNGLYADDPGNPLMKFADDYYINNGYGYGGNYDGCILTIDMGSREVWIATEGYGHTVLTDYGIDAVVDEVCTELGNGNNYAAVKINFVENVKWLYDQASAGTPYDVVTPSSPATTIFSELPRIIIISLIIGAIVGLISALGNKSKLKTIRRKYEAHSYERDGSFKLSRQADIFLYSQRTRRRKPQSNNSNSSGGGSTLHRTSSGREHGGGGGKF